MTFSDMNAGTYVLTHLDLYDWGAFDGRHSAPIDPAGTAIIGPTGSGKTTVVDALMTLLVAMPRYNLASTGGHESDRDLVSYVRGVSGAGNGSEANEHVARQGPVITAIAARFSNGTAVVRVGGLFWFDSASSALNDLKRRWFFCLDDRPAMDDWLEAVREGGTRALKDLERAHAGLRIYDAKQSYLARLRNHFEVGDNAFALLNRAAGLKQLDSIDEVFRELVLDDRSAFENARAVAAEFDTLADIRDALETARKQRDTLLPIAKGWLDVEEVVLRIDEHERLQAVVPAFYGGRAIELWLAQAGRDRALHLARAETLAEVRSRLKSAEAMEGTLQTAYWQLGGQHIGALEERIATQGHLLARCQRMAADYRAWTGALGLGEALTAAAVAENQATAVRRRVEEAGHLLEQRRTAWELGAKQQALKNNSDRLAQALSDAEALPHSNIPPDYQNFRRQLSDHLGVPADQLPFVAELVEVHAQESRWRGAIERAIGGQRLRLLIAPDQVGPALAWINGRDNQLHVRVRAAHRPADPARFFDDGFTRKLNFKAHPHREALKHLLADIDRHCVDSVDALRRTPHAMTAEGLMSSREGYFDKQDQRGLDRDWMTGFDNRDQLARLAAEVADARSLHKASQDAAHRAQDLADATQRGLDLLARVEQVVFEDIDALGADAELVRLKEQWTALTAPASDAAQAKQRWDDARMATEALRREERDVEIQSDRLEQAIKKADSAVHRVRQRIGEALDPERHAWAAEKLQLPSVEDPAVLDGVERAERERIDGDIRRMTTRRHTLEQEVVRNMLKAKAADTGALSEAGTQLQDVPAYRERLRVLEQEALPEKLQRFLHYLNHSSDQGVTQLLSEIEAEVSAIEERLTELNATLERVDFQPGRYLRLEPQRVEHQSLRALRDALKTLRSAQMNDDAGESHYRALTAVVALLRDAVERRKNVGALALLDPRYRLQFAVWVKDRATGKVIEKRTGSQGGSGGEKEIIASYVLTASLSYALCPPERTRPLFGTVVLDEAFSKSSHAVAARIIRALTEFGLHPLFVTPNKELRLLRDHTRSAIVVHRKGAQATLTALSWSDLETHARQRAARRTEVDLETAR
ncbi:ATP-binding protein [Luteibacter sahnii]|uniref:ATP-binding protein n=1 Tax=Luteibacter sahnii TaxID=3021977 RepID=UPI002A6A8E49|nr:ATP-binding protein [Luteibacter sp. PPL193]MDY1548039.1 ATP-binding protein [Luteibacter sp. PPL193]